MTQKSAQSCHSMTVYREFRSGTRDNDRRGCLQQPRNTLLPRPGVHTEHLDLFKNAGTFGASPAGGGSGQSCDRVPGTTVDFHPAHRRSLRFQMQRSTLRRLPTADCAAAPHAWQSPDDRCGEDDNRLDGRSGLQVDFPPGLILLLCMKTVSIYEAAIDRAGCIGFRSSVCRGFTDGALRGRPPEGKVLARECPRLIQRSQHRPGTRRKVAAGLANDLEMMLRIVIPTLGNLNCNIRVFSNVPLAVDRRKLQPGAPFSKRSVRGYIHNLFFLPLRPCNVSISATSTP